MIISEYRHKTGDVVIFLFIFYKNLRKMVLSGGIFAKRWSSKTDWISNLV